MKRILYILSSLAVLGMMAVSCDLTEAPQAEAGRAILFGDEAGLRNYTYGFYNYLPDYGSAHKINVMHDHSAKMNIGVYEQGAYTTATSTSWSWGSIRNVNYFIKYNTDPTVSETVRNNYTGIARLFRAYLYYDKLVTYGGVPWIDKPLDPTDEELYKTQDSRDVIIQHIMEDLDYAAANITTTTITPYSNTVNKWTALALKSRICLFEGTFRKYHANGSTYGAQYLAGCTITANELLQAAADAAKQVMDAGVYKLHTGTVYEAGGRGAYRDLFISDNPVTEEVMLAYSQNKELSVLGEANWYYNSTSYGPHLSMTRAFAKTYLNADGTIYNEKTGTGAYKTFVQETTGRDARLCQTIRGADYTRKDKSGAYVKTAPDMSLSLTGYQYTKYVMDDVGYDNGRTNDNDVPLLRYAEVLLNYAEAKAELGTITAEDWSKTIGALRRRAGITGGDLDKLPTVVDTYLQSTFYPNVTSPVILEVRRERAIELILEGFRLIDLKRWACGSNWQNAPWDGVYIPALDSPIDLNGDGVNDVYVTADANYQKNGTYKSIAMTLNAQQKANKITGDPNGGYLLGYDMPRKWNDNMYIYPVPENVIQKNTNLTQNPGWSN
ncbi:MAG: RagB/SusD family nutrient uptake outer membrane protein [Bacteroidales bacterium]|nr:RagB/SusD family nutrient uptake outer membrane protein [Bacteroidales bacterium]